MNYCDHFPSVVRLSVNTFERPPLNPLGEFSSNLSWAFCQSGVGGIKICTNGHGPLSKMADMPINRKTLKHPSSPEPRKLWDWLFIYSIGDFDDHSLTYDLFTESQKRVLMHLYEENIEKSFSHDVLKTNGWNLQCMINVANPLSYNQNFVPRGYLPLPLGYSPV